MSQLLNITKIFYLIHHPLISKPASFHRFISRASGSTLKAHIWLLTQVTTTESYSVMSNLELPTMVAHHNNLTTYKRQYYSLAQSEGNVYHCCDNGGCSRIKRLPWFQPFIYYKKIHITEEYSHENQLWQELKTKIKLLFKIKGITTLDKNT